MKAHIKRSLAIYLIVIVVVQSALFVYLFLVMRDLRQGLNDTRAQLNQQEDRSTSLQDEIDHQRSLLRPVVLAEKELIAFPELKITLPYNSVTKFLQYYYDGDEPESNSSDIIVSSTLLNDRIDRQMDCLELVRVSLEGRSPRSSWEEVAGSINLSDGRTLHVIAAKAYSNNEASTAECADEVWTMITPEQVAAEFRKARSY